MERTLAVFLCDAGAALALAILKAFAVSGVGALPPFRVLAFAASNVCSALCIAGLDAVATPASECNE
jgi:hypothetical protein